MQTQYQPIERERRFPRFSKPHPTCPKHNRRLKSTLERMPTWTAMAIGFSGRNTRRKVYRCPVPDCHFCVAGDSQILLGKCERMHKALGRYKDLE